tara:strand:+ start:115 stop:552 length:438 start_codon:yes stop_codon:yes gene_type:complete
MSHLLYDNKSTPEYLSNLLNVNISSETGTVFKNESQNDLTGSNNLGNGQFTSNNIDLKKKDNVFFKDVTIYGYTSSSTAKLHFALSEDNINYYLMSDYATLTTKGSEYHFVHSLKDCPLRYVKIYNSDSSNTGNTKLYYIVSTRS